MAQLIPLLTDLGLTKKEAEVYLELLALGSTYASVVASRMGISRNLVRYVCQKLVKKGMCSETRKGNAFLYTAESPEKLAYRLSQEENTLAQRRKNLEAHMGDLQAIMNPGEQLPKVSFLIGKDGFEQFCEASLQCKTKEVLFVSCLSHFQDLVSKEYDLNYYVPKRCELGVHIKMLVVRTPETLAMQKEDRKCLREMRFIPRNYNIASTFFLFDNKITFVSTEKQINCTMIESTEISDMLRQLFRFMWTNAKKD